MLFRSLRYYAIIWAYIHSLARAGVFVISLSIFLCLFRPYQFNLTTEIKGKKRTAVRMRKGREKKRARYIVCYLKSGDTL